MDASQVAGLLVLLGVVGVLAAIVGSGIQAGPVKFPSIPGSRQKPLAFACAIVIAGGSTWWAVQQQSGESGNSTTETSSTPPPSGKLRVSLIPAQSNIRPGNTIVVHAEVYNSLGNQLGIGECQLSWSDTLTDQTATTRCIAKFTERAVSQPGVHLIRTRAQGLGGLLARGVGSVKVMVRH